jgi:ATP-binding cassette subfamily C (CFTR/MRP) protein 1
MCRETLFLNKVSYIREEELKNLKSLGYLSSFQSFFWNFVPALVSLVTFAVFALVQGETLTAQKVFVSLSLFNMLRFPLFMLPDVISSVMEASVSIVRLNAFLSSEELDKSSVDRIANNNELPFNNGLVKVLHASFKWLPDAEAALTNINFDLQVNEVVAVVGRVGMF